jgi:hypothetical protein
MFTQDAMREIGAVAAEFGLEQTVLLAVAEVESGGAAFAMVEGRKEPLIRFEGHYFDRRLGEAGRAIARAAGLSSPQAGGVKNPASQKARWAMLERAAAIDRKAAYESTSWGVGQVMGAHWAWLDFSTIDAFVAEARRGVGGQARLMAHYIVKAGLAPHLRKRDWAAFARGYNGPAYARYGYDAKLAAAYRRRAAGGKAPAGPAGSAVLKEGAKGDAVRDLQGLLAALGYPLAADGVFGAATRRAVVAFQKDAGLTADGIAGPATFAAIREAMPLGARPAGLWGTLLSWLARLFGS